MLDESMVIKYMLLAIDKAKESQLAREVPVGCVFVEIDEIDEQKAVKASAHNLTNLTKNVWSIFYRGNKPL
jgi:tRNA(Arg) A34 adenosine deaminase TadA